MGIVSFIYKLLFNQDKKDAGLNNPELFHSDNYLRPKHTNYRKCPNCNVEVNTNVSIVDVFGIKNVNGKNMIQSWCKKCRNSKESNDSSNYNSQEKIDIE